ncbi:hypothetical protein IMZ11_03535 [Microtetraspora sp. AC03309]|uniref:hypothetical protein n=1 Tax=Microtetraspora sp. AC03309 TaxID=2779376 RepID=UPI001E50E07C|nr:hypothetical protein [Microtetraspora sp. AC03309]MCC5574708.1 hypothetical protein [Microtetraspora sp. AC03309]
MKLAVWRESGPIPRDRARDLFLDGPPEPDEDFAEAFAELFPGVRIDDIAPERIDEISNAVFRLAREHGLVCYDPQRGLVHNLEPRGVHPQLEMHTGDGMVVTDPDLRLIADVLGTLSPENPFVALVCFGQHFIQVSPGYELEFKEGGKIRGTVTTDLAEVRRAFLEYATGDRAFLQRHEWKPV